MVQIQGVDPILMERIRDKNRKTVIYESDQSRQVTERKEREHSKQRQQYKGKKLELSVDKLNKLLEEITAPIRFSIIVKGEVTMVQVIDLASEKVLSEVLPEKIYQFIRNIDDPKGFIIDGSI